MDVSIVTTLYRSSPYLKEFHRRMSSAAQKISDHYEIILVNDGSPDDSLETAIVLQKADHHVRVVDLSRNFGHHKALMTGLSFTHGDIVFLINCDLEEEPEDLEAFYKKMTSARDIDVVYGVHKKRKGNMLGRLAGSMFYAVLNRLTKTTFDSRMLFSRLMTRRYVKSLLEFRENELFLIGLWQLTGYRQVPHEIATRFKGESSYTLRKKVALAVNAVTSFTDKPLVYISYLGVFISLISGSFILYIMARKILFSAPLLGWTSLIVSIWFVGGLLLLCMGVIGIYLSKIFIETKRRPYSIVRAVYPSDNAMLDIESTGNPDAQKTQT
jgi:putative glycosyltransferase